MGRGGRDTLRFGHPGPGGAGSIARISPTTWPPPALFAPFAPYFDPLSGRPSTPVECYLRLMFLKFRYRLGFESLCAEVGDSIFWRRFCRIPRVGKVPLRYVNILRAVGRAWVMGSK